MKIHKAMTITDGIFQTNNNLFMAVIPQNACKTGFSDNLWLLFLDQPQSDVVVFSTVSFQIYKIIVT